MNSAADVANMIGNWSTMGLTKAEMAVRIAEACLGWPYVWGGAGQYCRPANRQSYANRTVCPEAEAKLIRKQCQVLSGSRGSCDGCKWFPNSVVRFFDCRGFTRWTLEQVGIKLQGGGATSQWNTASNWTAKGTIDTLPDGIVCCLFMQNKKDHKTMEHTGLHIGGGQLIHCSGEVKRGKASDRGWTHWAIPVGIEGDVPVPTPTPTHKTIRRGSTGPDVVECQKDLISLGYDLSPYGADGKFGRTTEEAVKAFQTDHRLKPDGIVGPATWGALDASVGPQPEPEPSIQLYTVTIPHLAKHHAEALVNNYEGATMTPEEVQV
jgi:cell wall-associated NlpC family hydrolase